MDDHESLKHTKWECQYRVVSIPACRLRLADRPPNMSIRGEPAIRSFLRRISTSDISSVVRVFATLPVILSSRVLSWLSTG
jgi:hypothetical protein